MMVSVGELTENLRAVPDPEKCREIIASYVSDPQRAVIRCSVLGSLYKFLDESLRFTLEEESVNAKECVFNLCTSGGQRT
jgi:hypothetical protein